MEYPNRIRELRESRLIDGRKMTIEQLSEATGLSVSYLSRLETGERNLSLKTIKKVSKAFSVRDADVIQHDNHIRSEQIAADLVPREDDDLLDYAGVVEAGAFRQVDELDQPQPHKVKLLRSADYPMARHMAYKVAGDAMDLELMLDGMWAEAVDFEQFMDYYGDVKDGDLVVVERSEAQGALRERTVKRLAVYPDRWELEPRSSNPKHKAIVISPGLNEAKDQSVAIVGLVLTWGMLAADRRRGRST